MTICMQKIDAEAESADLQSVAVVGELKSAAGGSLVVVAGFFCERLQGAEFRTITFIPSASSRGVYRRLGLPSDEFYKITGIHE